MGPEINPIKRLKNIKDDPWRAPLANMGIEKSRSEKRAEHAATREAQGRANNVHFQRKVQSQSSPVTLT